MMRMVVDTNILVAAILQPEKTCRMLVRQALHGMFKPLMGEALFLEYADVLSRDALFKNCPITAGERDDLFNAFLACCDWVTIYYRWRPNLPDESDNHLIELAVAGRAEVIVTRNIRHLTSGELNFDPLRIVTPEKCLKDYLRWER